MNCDDGNLCTIDACVNGVCQHVPVNCDDGNSCTIDQCINGICTHTLIAGCPRPPIAVCESMVLIYVDENNPAYNGPGSNDIFLIPASEFDGGSTSVFSNPLIEVKRSGSFIGFDWTTNGACIDLLLNNNVTDEDKGKLYKNCLPVSPGDFFQSKPYKMRITDNYGSDECSGHYKVVPFKNQNAQNRPVNDLIPLYQPEGQNAETPEVSDENKVYIAGNYSSGLMVYPNPGENEFFVTWTSDEKEDIEISMLDFNGLQVVTRKIVAKPGINSERIESNEFNSGVYILQFRSKNTFQSIKWVKSE
jgi:hypothetical protein